MGQLCSVCQHPARASIDATLCDGSSSNRRIASVHGLSEISVRRHRANHLPGVLVKAKEAAEVARADDLLSQVRDLQVRTLAILAQAEEGGDLKTALAAIGQARGNLELLARLLGEL